MASQIFAAFLGGQVVNTPEAPTGGGSGEFLSPMGLQKVFNSYS
jgi:hypothetical protein